MLFGSAVFFAFFAVYYLLHRIVPAAGRVYLIIAGSTFFYAWWKVELVWLPYLLTAIAFLGALWMGNAATPAARKYRLAAVLVLLFLPLAVFKYANFLYQDVLGALFFVWQDRLVDLSLPLGVSFITFTLTAYVVDCYRGHFQARRKASTLLAHVLFFPHLIAGPILRPAELIPQLEQPRTKRKIAYAAAIAIFTIGLVKKLVFADQLAESVDAAYGATGPLSAPQALLAIYGFSAQIYCDFSGYTDMAIGLALLLGIRLPTNFHQPYTAVNLMDFWRRWHITLSLWLRDYLYIPLGGNRSGLAKQVRNLMITMLLGGLWHGANWTFVLWGGLHGLGISALHLLKRFRMAPLLPRWLGIIVTFHFVTVAWAFFRAGSPGQAIEMLAAPFVGNWDRLDGFMAAASFPLLLLAVLCLLHPLDDHRRIKRAARRLRPEILWPVMLFLWIMAITVSQGSSAKFVYFDF